MTKMQEKSNAVSRRGNGASREWSDGDASAKKLGPETAEPIGIGVIGAGYWGPLLIRNFSELPTADVQMVADSRQDRCARIEQHLPRVRTTNDHTRLINDPAVDAVIVATPIRTHFQLARQALLAGKHVFVEKPLAASSLEAEDLVNLADQLHLCLMVGHTFEYNPAVQQLRKLVLSGDLGHVHYIDAARLSLGLFQNDVNVLWDLAPHDVSILRFVLGTEPLTVRAHGNGYVRSHIEDVAYMELQFPNDIMAHVHVSWLEPCKVRRVTLVGDRKMVVYNDVSAEEKIKIYDKGVSIPSSATSYAEFQLSYRYGDVVSPRVTWQEPLHIECKHFLDCIKSGTAPQSDGWSGLQVVRILERANQSLAMGGARIRIEDGRIEPFLPMEQTPGRAIPAAS